MGRWVLLYEARGQKDILSVMLKDSKAKTGVFEGTFQYDSLASNSIEFAKVELELEQLYKATFADTSWGEYLTMIAKQFGVIRKKATRAIGLITIYGNATVPRGSLFATQSGIRFTTVESVEIKKNGIVKIEALTFGSVGNVHSEMITQIPMSIPGIEKVTNIEATYGGYDDETDKSLLDRYLFKVRMPATSGNKNHYILWAREVEGVGDARCIPTWNGNGTVKVIIVDDNFYSANMDLVEKTYNYIDSVKPIGCALTVVSAVSVHINISADITGTISEEEFKKSVFSYFKTIGFENNHVSVAKIGKIILECGGVKDYDNLKLNGQSKNVLLTEEELPTLNEVTFNVSIST